MKLCDRCPGAGNCLLNYLGKACCNWRKKNAPDVVLTNADRIRAMSDEELAVFLNEPFCDKRTHEECTVSYCGICHQCVLDWLQQPAEEG